jgi:peptide-methionine (S)-S-oxide reductase
MKIHRSATLLLASAASSAYAFSLTGGSRHGGAFLGRSVARHGVRYPTVATRRPVSSTGVTMILDKLFGNSGGGAYQSPIAYENLDFPGPELAECARDGRVPAVSPSQPHLHLATFAGGCFWGLELAYQRVPGVEYTAVGYAQGPETNPTYNQVCAGSTGHTEAVMVYYNPDECRYEDLLDTFFERVDPTTVNGQGGDRGKQYRTGVYFHTPEQEQVAQTRFAAEQPKYNRPMASELKAAAPFWPAEKYHQQYLEKGGRFNQPQNANKGATDTIRCYG